MQQISPQLLARLRHMIALARRTRYRPEAQVARRKIRELLQRHGMTLRQLTLRGDAVVDPELAHAVGAFLLQPYYRVKGVEVAAVLRWAAAHGLLHQIGAGELAGRLVVGPGRWPKLKEFNRHYQMITRLPPKRQRSYYLLPADGTRDVRQNSFWASTNCDAELLVRSGWIPPVPTLRRPPRFIYREYAATLPPATRRLLTLHFPNAAQDRQHRQLAAFEDMASWRGQVAPGTCTCPVLVTILDDCRPRRDWRPCGRETGGTDYCPAHRGWAQARERLRALPGPGHLFLPGR